MADATILSWITPEVDQALERVRRNIVKFLTVREDPALLQVCPEHLHQVSGALRMVGLAGATRFCETLERSFPAAGAPAPAANAIEVIDRSVVALKEFVAELARGQANVPLKLLPAYRDLERLHGRDATEKDLFFPDLASAPPAHEAARTLPAPEFAPFLQQSRVAFERGMLAWLRDPKAGLDEMRRALDALHQVCASLPEPRGLWWSALALLDALAEPPDAEWLKGAKAILTRIGFHIRDLAGGPGEGAEALARDLLYAVAKAKPLTPRIRDVKMLYQLDTLFPLPAGATVEPDVEFLEVALYDLHSRLDSLKSAWVRYVSGEQKSAEQFRGLVATFKTKAAELGNQHLTKLLDAIGLVAARLPDPHPRQSQQMVIEMAAAFLLVEFVIGHFSTPPEDLDRQIGLMGGWLLDAQRGKSTGEPPAGLRAELTQQIDALQLRAQVAREILANLQHVEQVLDAFSRDPGKRETLPGLEHHLHQIHGALNVLGFARAAQALKLCERMIKTCAEPAHKLTARDMDWIAEGLSSVGFYLEPCLHGHAPGDAALALFFDRFEAARKSEATAPPDITITLPEPGAAPEASPEKQSADAELRAIFFEEAGEVLGNIEAALPQLEAEPGDHEALTTVRRGFHTLKGSGRMVGLMDLGEIAWELEQVMNAWLEEKRAATLDLLALVRAALPAFHGWLEMLQAGAAQGEIDASDLVAHARRVKTGEPAEAPVAQVDFGAETVLAPAPAAEPEVTVFQIYTTEAGQRLAALEAELAAWIPGSEASEEFMRAAHTLKSSSRTAGFNALAALAAALEQWMPFAVQTGAADAGVLRDAVAKLKTMVEAVVREAPEGEARAETQALEALVARLKTPPPTPSVLLEPTREKEKRPEVPKAKASDKRVMRDDIDAQLLPIFLEEAQELLPAIGGDLRDWKANPQDAQVLQSLQRALHTLKGSARMAGAIRLGELTHLMESRIEAALEAGAFPAALFEDLEAKMDRLSLGIEDLHKGEAAPAAEAAEAAPAEAPLPAPAALLRVNADTLDQLINEAGEVAIARSRMEAELRAVKQSLADLSESVARLRGQLREVEVQADSQMQSRLSVVEERGRDYDPLEFDRYTRLQELTRLMAESLNDVVAIQQAMVKNAGETEAALLQQARISRGVQQELMRMRAVPFANLNERLYRVVRQAARELDKKAELEIEGAEVELDRSVLERIAAPLEHLLRNAVAHGLEAPEARLGAGKPEAGRIRITLRQEANEIALVVADDGAGLDLERLRRKGAAQGLLKPDAEPSEAEIMQLVFVPGFSTAEAVTELAGRGVGMDVVKSEIVAIGGRVDIASTRGQGASFTLYLPLTLAVTQALLVRSGPSVLAIATGMIEQVLRLKGETLAAEYEKGLIESQERSYPLHYVEHLVGRRTQTTIQGYNSVLLLRSGVQRAALHVDGLIANQEIVVKGVGPQLSRIPGVSGATVLADGTIALIVNPVQLAHGGRAVGATTSLRAASPETTQSGPLTRLVLVVDDSLTVRKVTGRLLEREGYRVITAKDGVDALELLKDARPDAMLVDIEMPRMDGFELTRNVRGDPRSARIPIIVISSRTAEKHRAQAAALGVNAFLGKPYQEAELLAEIERQIAA